MRLKNTIVAGSEAIEEVVYGYTLPSARNKRIKISYSSQGLKRFVQESAASPEVPQLLFVIRDREAWYIEKKFLENFKGRESEVMGGNWFDVCFKDVLNLSPSLRTAAAVECRAKTIRASLALCMGVAVVAVLPAFLVASVGLLEGWGWLDTRYIAGIYTKALVSGNISEAAYIGWQILVGVSKNATIWFVAPFAMLLVASPSLPLILRKERSILTVSNN